MTHAENKELFISDARRRLGSHVLEQIRHTTPTIPPGFVVPVTPKVPVDQLRPLSRNASPEHPNPRSITVNGKMDDIEAEDHLYMASVREYHLMLLPAMLCEEIDRSKKNVKLGFVLQTPFPSSEIYRILAETDEMNMTGDYSYTTLVHEYHLMLLPAMLREEIGRSKKNVKLGFFTHTPFPSSEIYRILDKIDDIEMAGYHLPTVLVGVW
ncbi:glycosyltransferase family 20-domain-containing protein [Clohesyomyces aquaticus]|uniref:Glycosyltransferase family 20-domain-containing protein n=1 Tax=Clohesyomyces aquaticus TaxID=1231657 RepID=A0A1Y1YN05_9PLEO|nr:glycosyltransferase family 20-domain-containing protein [Clohesyomyces aquaticus]